MNKIFIIGGLGLLYLYTRQKEKTCEGNFYLIDNQATCETDIQDYFLWYSSNPAIESGYYSHKQFSTGFGETFDKEWVKAATDTTRNNTIGTPEHTAAQNNLEQYYNGTSPLKTI